MEGLNMSQQDLQKLDQNSNQESSLLEKKLNTQKLLEQIKDLKQGDEITVRIDGYSFDGQGEQIDYTYYHNMIFECIEQNNETEVSFKANFYYKDSEKEDGLPENGHYSSNHSFERVTVIRGFNQRIYGEVTDEDGTVI